MVFPPLHLPTLLVVIAVVIVFSGLLLVLARGPGHNSIALTFWGVAMMVGAVGITLLSITPALGFVAGMAGNAAILLGTALSWTAARVFVGRRLQASLALAGPVGWLLWGALPLEAAGLIHTILALVIGAAYTLAAAAELWRGRQEPLRSRNAVIVLLVLHAGVYLGRAVSMGIASTDGTLPTAAIATALMFEALLHTIGMAFLLLAIMRERAELRSTIQLRELAMLDGLTGLGNRRQFDQALDHEFRRALRDRAPLALLMIDADHFKAFNDTYGHQSGDDCLRAIASAIRSATQRPGDVGVRYGGEEFAVLLPKTDETGAVAVAEMIQANIAALRIEHTGSPHRQVAVSIGVAAVMPNQGSDQPDKLVRSADRALYAAKAAGRNRTQTAGQSAGQAPSPALTLVVSNATSKLQSA